MPHSLELPRMRRAVVPLVSSCHAVIHKLVPRLLPRLAAVIRALNDLPEPSARLRTIQPVRVHRRTLGVIDLPTRKVRPTHIPLLPLSVRRQHKRALPCTNQQSHLAHRLSSSRLSLALAGPRTWEPIYHQRTFKKTCPSLSRSLA